MTKSLELKFDTSIGKTMTLTLNEPKENLTAAEVEIAMQTIIDSNIFHQNGDSLVAINQARIVERLVSDFNFAESI